MEQKKQKANGAKWKERQDSVRKESFKGNLMKSHREKGRDIASMKI